MSTTIEAIEEPLAQGREKVGQNSLTPYPRVFIMQDIERMRRALP